VAMILSAYYLELAAIPFQAMFFAGFSFIGALSIKHSKVWNEYIRRSFAFVECNQGEICSSKV
jgi:hypothetical protein